MIVLFALGTKLEVIRGALGCKLGVEVLLIQERLLFVLINYLSESPGYKLHPGDDANRLQRFS